MSLVKIPTSHFVTSAKRQYADIDTAIVREAVQNSVDAGSTKIEIEVGDNWVRVSDNGCGMTEQVLVDAMLTMSGTHKSSSGAIGGFGAAKEILLFQHDHYEIHTQDNVVTGSVLEYDLKKTDYRQGTSITMFFHESYAFDKAKFEAKAYNWLSKCDAKSEITLNGTIAPRFHVTKMVKDLDWAKLYCDDSETVNQYATVRINGVCMFSSYIGEVRKNIVLEIVKPSINILTSNRDYFQFEYSEQIQKLITEITIDKSSFGRCHQTITRYAGNAQMFISRVLRQIVEKFTDDTSLTPSGQSVKSVIETMEQEVASGQVEPDTAISRLREISKTVNKGWVIDQKLDGYINDVDFYIQINDTGYDKVPAELAPSDKMKKKYRTLACLWKTALKHVFETNQMHAGFCIGWIVDSQCAAAYQQKDGLELFLLSPYMTKKLIDVKDKKKLVSYLVMTAAHEISHRFNKYHDENFVARYDRLLLNAMSELSYRDLIKRAEKETL